MTDTPRLALYHGPNSRSIRARWMLEEMGLPYVLKPVAFDARPIGDAAYEAIHPLRKVPVLDDNGQIVRDSVAITQAKAALLVSFQLLPDFRPLKLYKVGPSGPSATATALLLIGSGRAKLAVCESGSGCALRSHPVSISSIAAMLMIGNFIPPLPSFSAAPRAHP